MQIFSSDLDFGACIFKENVPIETLNMSIESTQNNATIWYYNCLYRICIEGEKVMVIINVIQLWGGGGGGGVRGLDLKSPPPLIKITLKYLGMHKGNIGWWGGATVWDVTLTTRVPSISKCLWVFSRHPAMQ